MNLFSPASVPAKILIVDDEPINIKVLNAVLGEGYELMAATGGEQALKLATSASPDLILLDILMPDIDGHEVCRRLKMAAETKNIPVIFITAMSSAADETTGFELGAVDYITKPFSPPIVLARVRTHLSLRRQAAQLERGNLVLSEEINERKRVEAALREASNAAEAANRAKSAFLANMSHEIRTPMNAIIGLAQLALRTELTAKQYGYVKKIDGAAELLLGLINDVLDMAKIEAGKMSFERIPFRIDDVMNRVADTMEMAAHEKGIELVVHRAPEIPCMLVGDPLRLSQVLLNLASNAVKFTSAGEVALTAECDRFDEAAGDIVLRFSVADTGIGISDEQLAKLFLPFSQADMSVTRLHGGSGLGLAIVKELVQLMGGGIEVASAPGVGSDFSFTLRFAVAPPAAAADAAAPDFADLRVLIVDDNDTARLALQHALASAGCRVTAVSSGLEAIAELRAAGVADPYQLVLMDWNMPGLDGVETTRRIKRDAAIRQQPVIVMVTAYSREEVAARAARLETAFDAYLLKPVKPPTLFNAIARIFGLAVAEEAPPAADAGAPPSLAGRRILVVEDNAYNQLVARELLEGAGLVVDIAENGREAVDRVLATAAPYDAVLMDVQMPVMDGWVATRELRGHEPGRALPIIGMTAYTMVEDIERCRAAGMDDVITKPVRLDTLLGALARRLGTTAPAAAAAPPDAATDSAELIDVPGALNRLADNEQLLYRLLQGFVDDEGDNAQKLRRLIDAGSLDEADRLAHTVKGTGMILGLDRLTAAAAKLEAELRRKDRAGTEAAFAAFARELAAALDACARLLAQRRPAESDAPERAVAPPPREAMQALVDEIAALVERNHMDALKLVKRLHWLLGDMRHGAAAAALRDSVDELDFDSAREHARALAAALRDGDA